MDIIVFKTNVHNADEVSRVATLLTAVPGIQRWNFDLEDCDNILRVVANQTYSETISLLLQTAGLHCEELNW